MQRPMDPNSADADELREAIKVMVEEYISQACEIDPLNYTIDQRVDDFSTWLMVTHKDIS